MEVVDVYTEGNPEPNDRTGRRECKRATSEGGRQDILKGSKNVVNLLTKVKGSRNGSTDAEERGPALGGQLKR